MGVYRHRALPLAAMVGDGRCTLAVHATALSYSCKQRSTVAAGATPSCMRPQPGSLSVAFRAHTTEEPETALPCKRSRGPQIPRCTSLLHSAGSLHDVAATLAPVHRPVDGHAAPTLLRRFLVVIIACCPSHPVPHATSKVRQCGCAERHSLFTLFTGPSLRHGSTEATKHLSSQMHAFGVRVRTENALPCPALPCPALPCPAPPCPPLPCPALPCPARPCPAPPCDVPCPALPCPALPCPALPCPALPCPAPPCPALPCPALPCPALPCPALPCPALPCPALPCPAPPCPALPCDALPCRALPCPALRCPALPCPALPCPVLPCPALRCPAPPCPTLPCPALPCPALPCPALPCDALPCPALPCPALPCPALPCHALPCPALPCPALGLGLGLGVAFSGETPPLPPYPCVHLHAYLLCYTQSQNLNQAPIPAWLGLAPVSPGSCAMLLCSCLLESLVLRLFVIFVFLLLSGPLPRQMVEGYTVLPMANGLILPSYLGRCGFFRFFLFFIFWYPATSLCPVRLGSGTLLHFGWRCVLLLRPSSPPTTIETAAYVCSLLPHHAYGIRWVH